MDDSIAQRLEEAQAELSAVEAEVLLYSPSPSRIILDHFEVHTAMTDNPLFGLKGALRGELITRDEEEAFATARFRGWNRDLNRRSNPLGFVVASGVRDIVTAVNYCRENSLKLAVRSKGAHSPYGMADDAVVIDLMGMTAVRVDPDFRLDMHVDTDEANAAELAAGAEGYLDSMQQRAAR